MGERHVELDKEERWPHTGGKYVPNGVRATEVEYCRSQNFASIMYEGPKSHCVGNLFMGERQGNGEGILRLVGCSLKMENGD